VRIKLGNGLLLLNILNVLLILIVVFLPWQVLKIILGIPFVLFFSGYALTEALFPAKANMGGIERIAVSIGLSIAWVALLLLVFNYTAWGITLETILYSIASSILIFSIIAYFRQRKIPEQERFNLDIRLHKLNIGTTKLDRTLSIALVVVGLVTLGFVIFVIVTPKQGETFTEFYLPKADVESSGQIFIVGNEVQITVGIVNHENKIINYYIEVMIDGIKNSQTEPIQLSDEEKWEGPVSFTPNTAGHEKIEFYLYEEGGSAPFLADPLILWMDFTQ